MALVSKSFSEVTALRRSRRALESSIPVSYSKVVDLCKQALLEVPSAFDNQATRLTVLFGEHHRKLWSIIGDILKSRIGEKRWEEGTKARISKFSNSCGTILFWDDMEVVEKLKTTSPDIYKDKTDEWIYQSNGMHQYYLWTGLAGLGLGANLQHYNPIIDDQVRKAWNVPQFWRLEAQMVFGSYTEADAPKAQKLPMEDRLEVFGVEEQAA